ncbi:YihA family ribosome biogenesis GTP-binding protein [Acetobacteraceae bacterium]|nr:YihA family ribosome biogenesis GTP-binding protein [Acetobacteraceae bacterium]
MLKNDANLEADRFSEEEINFGRKLFAQDCSFFHGAQVLEHLPAPSLPEVAFVGRSNVGKSSIINAITGQNALARTSSEPGRTKQLNFFNLGKRLVLVDLPGYGFAKASKEVKEDWQKTMFLYLQGRPTLRQVVVLVDARVGVKQSDKDVFTLLDKAAISYRVVFTKVDDARKTELDKHLVALEDVIRIHPAANPEILFTSSRKNVGIEALRAILSAFSAPKPVL